MLVGFIFCSRYLLPISYYDLRANNTHALRIPLEMPQSIIYFWSETIRAQHILSTQLPRHTITAFLHIASLG